MRTCPGDKESVAFKRLNGTKIVHGGDKLDSLE
jgi:hypothetical protein